MTAMPELPNPPVVEVVLGVQFSPLSQLTAGHYGWFWQQYLDRDEWTTPSDAPLLDDQFETFERTEVRRPLTLGLRLEPVRMPDRFIVAHSGPGNDRVIQIQPSRFHLNWRKGAGQYLSYKRLIVEFERLFDTFSRFATDAKIGPLLPNQWELTYVDAFPQGEYWETLMDWAGVLPGLFGVPVAADGLTLDHRAAEWSYQFPHQRGRLHVVARLGVVGSDPKPTLLLQTTARGPVGRTGTATVREGLDLGHAAAVETFFRVVSATAKKTMGMLP